VYRHPLNVTSLCETQRHTECNVSTGSDYSCRTDNNHIPLVSYNGT